MEILSAVDDVVTLKATRRELAQLSMLLNFIIDNLGGMDESTTSLRQEDIRPSIQEWLNLIHQRTTRDA